MSVVLLSLSNRVSPEFMPFVVQMEDMIQQYWKNWVLAYVIW